MPKHAFIFCFAVGLSLTDKAFCLPIYSIAIVQIVFPEMVFENAIRSNHCIGVRREITNVCIPVFCQAVDWNISRSRTIYSWCRVKEKAKYLFQLLIVCFKRQNLILKNIIYCHDFSPINDNLETTGLAIFKEKFSSPNDGFDETPLYDLAEYINGTSFSEDEYSSDGLPIIKIAELKDGITSATQYFVGNKDPKYLIHDSDVLFSWSGNPDTSIDAFIWSHGDGILNQHTFRMVPRYGVAFTYFMLKFCKPEFVKAAMGKQTTGLGHVTVKDLKRLTLPFNEETAFLFNQAAMPLYEQIFKNLKEINALIELKKQTVQMLSIINH